MNIINTSAGPKSPADALAIFTQAKLPAGSLFGIFNQLLNFLAEGAAACEHVLANESLYSGKIVCLAKEQKTGKPIGLKAVKDQDDIRRFFNTCGIRSTVAFTIRENQASQVRQLLTNQFIKVAEEYKMGLMAVGMSGYWSGVSRTFFATVTLPEPIDVLQMLSLDRFVETLELIKVLEERPPVIRIPQPLGQSVLDLLGKHPHLFYDRELFLKVTAERAFANQFKRVDELSENSSMEDVLMLFHGNMSREEFLEYYIEAFNAALA